MEKILFTSESVTEGHPDKVCDQISDGILDAILAEDPDARVACETLVTTGLVVIAGEITKKHSVHINYSDIARDVIKKIGYTDSEMGFDYKSCAVISAVHTQSPDISMGVTPGEGTFTEQGAGDQGMMFGYACNETPEYLPLPIMLAHQLTMRLAEARKKKILNFLRPDGKSQVTIEYHDGNPVRVDSVVVSTQHKPMKISILRKEILSKVIKHVIPSKYMDSRTRIFVNPTGRFVVGGPHGDTGVTGRKIIVDTYGGMGRHGGGAFSGKDPSKVDRSATYMARHIAKNIVAARIAEKCEVQLSYAIGYPEPISVLVDCLNTNRVPLNKLSKAVRDVFPLKPADIIRYLKLKRPIYGRTASYGHFGRKFRDFTWENTDKASVLRKKLGIK